MLVIILISVRLILNNKYKRSFTTNKISYQLKMTKKAHTDYFVVFSNSRCVIWVFTFLPTTEEERQASKTGIKK